MITDLPNLTLIRASEHIRNADFTSHELTTAYLEQIRQIDAQFNAVIEVNPDALSIAHALDLEHRQGRIRGPLHGIPILVKDNIGTADRMATSAGSLALADSHAVADAFVVKQLRQSGAIILGKTNLSEWANGRSTRSCTGWSSRGGQTRNPFDPDRSPGGSSSGSAVAVTTGMCTASLGTETDGSVVIPAAMNSLVGFKPTVGLVSRTGIVPLSFSQDTAGPITRSVADAAMLFCAMMGVDPKDAGSRAFCEPIITLTGLHTNSSDALNGARIGVARSYFGYHEQVDALMAHAMGAMRDCGGVLVDDIPLVSGEAFADNRRIIFSHEFKAGLNAYLKSLESTGPIQTLDDVIAFNTRYSDQVMPYFGQEKFLEAQAAGSLDNPPYLAALAAHHAMARRDGIDAALREADLDVLIAPTVGPPFMIDSVNGDNRSPTASPAAAAAGYPHITVPLGFVHGLPVGISFFASAMQDAKVIRYAHAYEQQTKHRRAPGLAGEQ